MYLVWPSFYGLLTVALLGVCYRWRRVEDALLSACVVAFGYVHTNLAEALALHPRESLFPAFDYASAVLLAWLWRNRLRPWKLVLIALFMIDEIVDSARYLDADQSFFRLYVYDLTLNVLYMLQLAATCCGARPGRSKF